MKNSVIKIQLLIQLVLLFPAAFYPLHAADITVKSGEAKLTVSENTYSKLRLSNSISKLTHFTVNTEKGVFTELSVTDYGYSGRIGEPKLPALRKLIEIPLGAAVKVNVISCSVSEYNLSDYGITHKLMPLQPSVSKNLKKKTPDFEFNATVYNNDQFNTDELVSSEILGIMRGVRLARLEIFPVRYNPVTNTIRVYNDIEVEITFPGADIPKTLGLKKNTYSVYFESMYNSRLINYKKGDVKDSLSKYPVKYVIVSDPAFKAALQPFVQWKTKKGFTVLEAYTDNPLVGDTTTLIKNYLDSLYNAGTPSSPAPTFVLFVGDVAQIPAFTGYIEGIHSTDLYYCEYTGDYLPEVYYGRFSANNITELQPQINKTLEYEQYLMPDPSFLDNVVMVAGQDYDFGPLQGDGQINYGTSTYFNAAHGLNSHTYLYAISGNSASSIIQNVSDGVCFANYTAHGSSYGWFDPSFSISDIAGLQNAHKYPLMVGNCCQSNMYDYYCFGEELLRADNKGAIGYIGASDYSYWDEDYWWAVGYKAVTPNPVYDANSPGSYDCTFHDHGEQFGDWFASQGQMIFAGNLAVTQAGGDYFEYYWEIYCLMGDPSLMIYYGVPPPLTAIYAPYLPLASTTFTVTTEPYSYVGLSSGGVLYGAALADSAGVAVVPVSSFPAQCTADVVVTKQNRAPFISTVMVGISDNNYSAYSSDYIRIFPNPSAGAFNVELTGFKGKEADITIYDVKGQAVIKEKWQISTDIFVKELRSDALTKGVYIMKLTGDSGVSVSKIIVE